MQIRAATIALLGAAFITPVQAGLCAPDEVAYFSCTAGKRQIALCGSQAVDAARGYIEYRVQDGNARVQVFPKARRPPGGVFTKDFVVWDKSGFEATVMFQVDAVAHVLYANLMVGSAEAMGADRLGIYGFHAGVRTYRGNAMVNDTECDRNEAAAIDPQELDRELPDFLDVSRK